MVFIREFPWILNHFTWLETNKWKQWFNVNFELDFFQIGSIAFVAYILWVYNCYLYQFISSQFNTRLVELELSSQAAWHISDKINVSFQLNDTNDIILPFPTTALNLSDTPKFQFRLMWLEVQVYQCMWINRPKRNPTSTPTVINVIRKQSGKSHIHFIFVSLKFMCLPAGEYFPHRW